MVNAGATGGGTAATVNDEEYAASAAAEVQSFDDAFLKMIICLELESNELPKYLKIRVSKWVEALSRPTSNVSFKSNRNAYMEVLLAQVVSGAFSEPFDKCDCSSAPNFPAHLSTPRRRSLAGKRRSRKSTPSSAPASPAGASQASTPLPTPLFAKSARGSPSLPVRSPRPSTQKKVPRSDVENVGDIVSGLAQAHRRRVGGQNEDSVHTTRKNVEHS